MSCYNCGGCISTVTMNICFDDFTITGLPNTTATVVTFENMSDNSLSTASGTTNGSGVLNITSANMPDFVAGVNYKVTIDQTWTSVDGATLITCAIIDFAIVTDSGSIVTGASVTVTECD